MAYLKLQHNYKTINDHVSKFMLINTDLPDHFEKKKRLVA